MRTRTPAPAPAAAPPSHRRVARPRRRLNLALPPPSRPHAPRRPPPLQPPLLLGVAFAHTVRAWPGGWQHDLWRRRARRGRGGGGGMGIRMRGQAHVGNKMGGRKQDARAPFGTYCPRGACQRSYIPECGSTTSNRGPGGGERKERRTQPRILRRRYHRNVCDIKHSSETLAKRLKQEDVLLLAWCWPMYAKCTIWKSMEYCGAPARASPSLDQASLPDKALAAPLCRESRLVTHACVGIPEFKSPFKNTRCVGVAGWWWGIMARVCAGE